MIRLFTMLATALAVAACAPDPGSGGGSDDLPIIEAEVECLYCGSPIATRCRGSWLRAGDCDNIGPVEAFASNVFLEDGDIVLGDGWCIVEYTPLGEPNQIARTCVEGLCTVCRNTDAVTDAWRNGVSQGPGWPGNFLLGDAGVD